MRHMLLTLLLLFGCVAGDAAIAQQKPYEIADFLRKPRFNEAVLSPNGTYLAVTIPIDDKTVLAVLRPGQSQPVGHFNMSGKSHVIGVTWANDEQLLFRVAIKDGFLETPTSNGDLWTMHADGSKARILIGPGNYDVSAGRASGQGRRELVFASLVDTLPNDDKNIIVSVTRMGTDYTTADRMNIDTGARVTVARAPIPNAGFVTDASGNVRFAMGQDRNLDVKTYYRDIVDGQPGEWSLIHDEATTKTRMSPVGFSEDGRTAYLLLEQVNGPHLIMAMDMATREMKRISGDDDTNPVSLVNAVGKRHIIGVMYNDPTPRFDYFNPDSADAKLHRTLQNSFGGDLVDASSITTPSGEVLLGVASDRNPGDYYAYNVGTKKAAHIISASEWLDPARLGETRGIEFTSRDGHKIKGYLTLPPGSSGRNLPLIVNPHGGPFTIQDTWGYESERQMLAAHGYAVLQVNFRGSGGYGRAFEELGARQWGRTMQDDLTDATRWAIQQGIADANRICIYGASYGGYASLMGVAKEPTLYKCAIGYVGVYDMPLMVGQDKQGAGQKTRAWMDRWIGNDMAALSETSPNMLASRIKVPVFLTAGGKDTTAPEEHTRRMEKALRAAGVPVESLYYPSEAHGYYAPAHRLELYTRLLTFLNRHIGGRAPVAAATN